MDELTERMYQAIKQAYQNMVPAKVGVGNGVCYLNVKRDLFDPERGTWWEGPDYDGKSDKTVGVLYFETLDGKPIATYYNYAMHAVITGQLDMITGDFPGKSEEYIESRYGDDFVAIFSSGAAGDQNPLYFQQTFDLRDIRIAEYAKRGEDISNRMPPGGQGLDRNDPEVHRLMEEQKKMAESYGQILGEEVKYVIMMMRRFETDVTLEAARTHVTCPGRRQTNGGDRAGYAGEYEDADDISLELGLVMLDDIPVCAVSGEPYNQIAVELKSKSPYNFTIVTTVTDGHNKGRGGYIPDDESYGAQVFEVLSSGYKQGYAQKAIVDGLLDLIHDATQDSWARWLVSKGVDVIVGGHPHVVQDTTHIKGVPVIYSLGNAISNMSIINSRLGLAATLRFVHDPVTGEKRMLEPELKFLWCTLPDGTVPAFLIPLSDTSITLPFAATTILSGFIPIESASVLCL